MTRFRAAYILKKSIVLLLPALLGAGCGSGVPDNGPTDDGGSGTIHISVDESFKPVIDSEIAVFEGLHPGAHIIA
ncbi:MAG: hypothetical protein EOP21_13295, partial [Hyphomicrobiales bacterium]